MTSGLINKYGPWVTGAQFFNRETEVRRLSELIDEGNNILIVAPRRVGKTSLVRETFRRMEDRERDYLLFVDVQHCSTPQDVIISLSLTIQPYAHLWDKVTDTFKIFFKQLESVTIFDNLEIKLREGLTGDWQAKGQKILHNLAQADRPLTICLDELPIMITRLLQPTTQETYESKRREADVFLSWLRQVMLQYQDKLRFIICGSIGLEPILKRHKLSHTITQLRPFPLDPWSRETAESCLNALGERYGVEWLEESRRALLEDLGSYLPHHVQMFFGLLHEDCARRHVFCPSPQDVERVYQTSMLSTRGHAELATYEERLLSVLEPESVPLALDLLTEAAVADGLTPESAQQLMQRAQLADSDAVLREVLDVLQHDGYLAWNDEAKAWQFVSRLVKDWWKKRFQLSYVSLQEGR